MKQAHIALDESVNAQLAILPGDPARLDHVKQYLNDVQELAYNREYRSLIGTYQGQRILAMSTGMGGASMGIAVEELSKIGVKALVRIGSCGALQKGIKLGDLVIAEGAIRDDGASKAYLPDIYPAVANYALLHQIIIAAKQMQVDYHLGIVHSHESFYMDENAEMEAYWSSKQVLGADFETAALLTIGRLRNVACASILNNVVVYGEDTSSSIGDFVSGAELTQQGEKNEILVALRALVNLELR